MQDVNRFLRGWVAYFRYGHSAQRLSKIRHYARMRLALFISKKHRRQPRLRMAGDAHLGTRGSRPDQLVWNRRRTQGGETLAGKAECRR